MKKMLFRKFKTRKAQTEGIILITVLWMFIASFSVNLYLTNSDFKETYFKTSNAEDFNFVPNQGTDADKLSEKYQFSYELQYIADFEDGGTEYRMLSDMEDIDIPYIIDGKKIHADDEILINREYAEVNDIQTGDTLTVSGNSYQVVGITSLVNYMNMHVRNDALNYDEKNQAVIVATRDTVSKMADAQLSVSYAAVFGNGMSDAAKSDAIKSMVLSKDFVTVTATIENSSMSVLDGKISVYFILTVISLCVLSVIIVILLIMFIFILIKEDRKNIGILIANGMKKGTVFREYFAAVLVLMIPSAVIGYLAGYAGSPFLNALLESDVSLPDMTFHFDVIFLILFLAVVFWVALLSTLCGTVGILRKNAIELIQNNKIKKISRFEKFIQRVFKTEKIERRVKVSFAIRNKLLLVLVLFSVFAAGVEFFLSYSIYVMPSEMKKVQSDSMNYENEVYFDSIDQKVSDGDQYYYRVNGIGKNGAKESVIQVYALEDGDYLKISDSDSIGTDEVILNKTTADVLHAKAGDVITVSIYDSEINLKVKSVCDRIVGKEAFVNYEFLSDNGMIDHTYNGMYTKKTDINENSYEGIQSILSRQEILNNYESSQDVMKYGAIILFVLGIVIPVILISITASILISENQREIDIFRANGIEEKRLDKLVYGSYNSFLAIGFLISIPYSYLILNIIFSIAVKASGIKYPVTIDALSIIFAAVLTCIVYFGSMSVMKHRNKNKFRVN